MQILNRCINFFRDACGEIAGWLIFFVTVFITLDVILRYFFGESLPASMEITQICLCVLVYFGFGKAQQNKVHIRVDFLLEKISTKVRRYLEIGVNLMAIVFLLLLLWGGGLLFMNSFAMKEFYQGVWNIPIYPARFAILMGFVLMLIELVRDLVNLLKSKEKVVFETSLDLREVEESIARVAEMEKNMAEKR